MKGLIKQANTMGGGMQGVFVRIVWENHSYYLLNSTLIIGFVVYIVIASAFFRFINSGEE